MRWKELKDAIKEIVKKTKSHVADFGSDGIGCSHFDRKIV